MHRNQYILCIRWSSIICEILISFEQHERRITIIIVRLIIRKIEKINRYCKFNTKLIRITNEFWISYQINHEDIWRSTLYRSIKSTPLRATTWIGWFLMLYYTSIYLFYFPTIFKSFISFIFSKSVLDLI